jgi:hypothetical protein
MGAVPVSAPKGRFEAKWLLVFLAAVAYALAAASTTPFTTPANVVTAIPLIGMAVAVLVGWPLRTASVSAAARDRAVAARGGSPSGTSEPNAGPRGRHPYLPWLLVLVAFAGWEVFNYVAPGSRSNYPTFSSMADAVDRYYLLKTLVFLAWVGFGWSILRRGWRIRHGGQPS